MLKRAITIRIFDSTEKMIAADLLSAKGSRIGLKIIRAINATIHPIGNEMTVAHQGKSKSNFNGVTRQPKKVKLQLISMNLSSSGENDELCK